MKRFVSMSMVSPHSGFDLYDADRVTKDFDLYCVAQNLRSVEAVESAWREYQALWGRSAVGKTMVNP